MRKTLMLFFVLCTCLWGFVSTAHAKDPPAQFGQWVVDKARLLTRDQRVEFSDALRAVQSRTGGQASGVQIAILTMDSLSGDDIKEFAIRTFRAWHLGVKGAGSLGKSNGVLIVIVKDTHAVRIEVGTGLEGALTDALSKQIIQARFNSGASRTAAEAVRGTIQDITTIVDKEYRVTTPVPSPVQVLEPRTHSGNGDARYLLFGVAIIFAGIFGAVFHRRRRFLRYWFGGMVGAGSWSALALHFSVLSPVFWIVVASGWVLGYFLAALFRNSGDGWLFDPFPTPYGGSGTRSGSSGLHGGGGDSAGAGSDGTADPGLFDGLGDAITNVQVPTDCPIDSCPCDGI